MADNFLDTLSTGLTAFGQGRSFSDVEQEKKDRRLIEMQRRLGIDDTRTNALFKDALTAQTLLDINPAQASQFIGQRSSLISEMGGNPSDTLEIKNLIDSGQITQARDLLSTTVRAGRESGILPKLKDTTQNREKRTAQEKNFERLLEIERTGTPEQANTFKKLLNLQDDPKLSARAEKAIIDAQDAFFQSGEQARKMELLANDIQRIDIGGGLTSSVTETFKDILGSQDEVTSLRKRFNAIRSSQATSNLPPGPASDKDIALALSGFPKENANAGQIIGFLKGQAKLERINEKFQEFKAEFIGQRKKPSGLIKAWKQQIKQEGFLDDVLNPADPIKNIGAVNVSELSDEDLFN